MPLGELKQFVVVPESCQWFVRRASGSCEGPGWVSLTGCVGFSAELVRQMARFGAENASTTSGEEFRQKLAEVERMLREMKERSLGAQEELARREHEEAKKCESSSAAQGCPGPAGSGLEPAAHHGRV